MTEKFIILLGIPKSLYLNFKFLKIKDAIKLPILISDKTVIRNLKSLKINSEIRTGMIKIGFGDTSIFDRRKSRTIIDIKGNIIFNGSCLLRHGTRISINSNGILELGNNFITNSETIIVCNKKIKFGDNCNISWENLIIDTDFHKIRNNYGEITNHDKEIVIGNNVWIGCRSTILKGSVIEDGNVISSNSRVSGTFKNNELIGGNPAKVLRENIKWEV